MSQLEGSERAIQDSVHALALFTLGELTVQEALQRILDLALEAAPGAASAGLTLMGAGGLRTPVASDPTAPELDEAQYQANRGPCVTALLERRIVRTEESAVDGAFPEFAQAALRADIHSSLSLPLVVGDQGVGALVGTAPRSRTEQQGPNPRHSPRGYERCRSPQRPSSPRSAPCSVSC